MDCDINSMDDSPEPRLSIYELELPSSDTVLTLNSSS